MSHGPDCDEACDQNAESARKTEWWRYDDERQLPTPYVTSPMYNWRPGDPVYRPSDFDSPVWTPRRPR